MHKDDLVSIIMPAYNTEKYVYQSIQSVINQTYTNWELIIVDDCSKDNTYDIVKKLEDKRIKYYKNDVNCGAALTRNKALQLAKGRYIAFLDSDDLWHKDKLKLQIQYMKSNNYSFTYTDYRMQNNGIWSEYINTAPNRINKIKLYNYCYFSTITVVYDVNIVGLIQIPDIRKNNDYAMWFKCIDKTDFYRLPLCLSYYIKHDDSISSGSKFKLIKWHYKLFRIMNKNSIVSSLLTANNIIFGLIKKFKYRKKIEKEDKEYAMP